ncbi:hypothetical protein AB835_11025 [Candidatus Endobugula sertula]|uniref:Anti sigma-E protein RseA N-terminal domain-containing protein n=1 Tax=Candidatus Endobugula sertula TaxID=62101 RepID=A0A1D2QN56_9GAMM|nr:hypothetical protein AB835_11025 [Candidatus Endobugula sertula]
MREAAVRQELKESLSALVDGEVTELELRRLLKTDDAEYEVLRKYWAGYQAVSANLKQKTPRINYSDLSLNISAAIADEPVHSSSDEAGVSTIKRSLKQGLWVGLGRFAIVASVATAVVVGVQFVAPDNPANQIVDSIPAPSHPVTGSFRKSLPSGTTVRKVSTGPAVQKPTAKIHITESTKQQIKEAEEQVNRLLLEHAQNAAQNTQQGILSYERVPESEPK